ncbi:hypothetical protein [Brachyspira sp. G79]|uniref:hypothetical protein n=1 Tax=Brachyspira sp. G79 TaxID=1358104 RepID=UPI000BBC06D3|nr:hypothetical protein [Brachyspira sp. G79]PCG18919.1 bacteriophage-like family protein [Brachyspira sp. G79]
MSEKNKVTLTGFDEFRKTLEELGIDFKNEVKKASLKEARRIAKEANAKAKSRGWTFDKYFTVKETRINKKSNTESNVKITTISGKRGTAPEKNKIKWYKEQGDRYYTFFNEYGNKYKNEVPLLIPLFESNRENIEEAVKSALNIVIQKANNK